MEYLLHDGRRHVLSQEVTALIQTAADTTHFTENRTAKVSDRRPQRVKAMRSWVPSDSISEAFDTDALSVLMFD